jgi:multidrug resistance efflux pump
MSLKRETRINLLLTFIFLIAGAVGFSVLKATRPQIERTLANENLPLVRTVRIQPMDLEIRIPSHGRLRSRQKVEIKAEVSGRLSYLHPSFLMGGFIKKNEILAKLEPKEYQLKVRKAEAGIQVRKAGVQRLFQEKTNLKASLKIARQNLSLTAAEIKRYREMLAENTVAKQDYENILFKSQQQESQVQNIENQLQQIPIRLKLERANLAIAKIQLAQAKIEATKTILQAPFSGKILKQAVSQGEFLPRGFSLGEMVNLETLEVETPLSSHEVPWLMRGNLGITKAKVEILAPPLGTLLGRVARLGSAYATKTGAVSLFVEIENPWLDDPKGAWLLPGAFCKVELMGPILKQVTKIPRTSENESRIQLVREDRILLMDIVPLRDEGSYLVVRIDFQAGDEIILKFSEYLTQGERVKTAPQLLNL